MFIPFTKPPIYLIKLDTPCHQSMIFSLVWHLSTDNIRYHRMLHLSLNLITVTPFTINCTGTRIKHTAGQTSLYPNTALWHWNSHAYHWNNHAYHWNSHAYHWNNHACHWNNHAYIHNPSLATSIIKWWPTQYIFKSIHTYKYICVYIVVYTTYIYIYTTYMCIHIYIDTCTCLVQNCAQILRY